MTIRVALGERSYAIALADAYAQLPRRLASLGLSRQGWVISHRSVLARYGDQLLEPLARAGWRLRVVTIPASERSKSFATVRGLLEQLARAAAMRVPVLFAFGGGVVGDVTGFVAAAFRRGVPYVQVPTTLLAQVDSAIGGKVGIDLPRAKNVVGAFYQPRLVYNNVTVLESLPARQRRSGLAEVIKYGVIADAALFAYLEAHLEACLALERRAVRVMIERSCAIKARVVSRDERETTGVRAQLNFGHTLGHALEAATHYRRWTHGEAIAIGMCAAARLAAAVRLCRSDDAERIVALIRSAGLPTVARRVSPRAVLQAMRYDKKFLHGRPRWVLPTRIGAVMVTEQVPEAALRRILADHVQTGGGAEHE